jgi:hypothetical protein
MLKSVLMAASWLPQVKSQPFSVRNYDRHLSTWR